MRSEDQSMLNHIDQESKVAKKLNHRANHQHGNGENLTQKKKKNAQRIQQKHAQSNTHVHGESNKIRTHAHRVKKKNPHNPTHTEKMAFEKE